LPVGGYTFSQGLEYAIESAQLTNAENVKEWIDQTTTISLVYNDLPIIKRQYRCIEDSDFESSRYWNDYALAIRETKELLLADTAMGEALLRLAKGMSFQLPEFCSSVEKPISFLTMYSYVATQMKLSLKDACSAYSWTVIENQVLAATKLLPLGQTDAQRMLFELSAKAGQLVSKSFEVNDEAIGLSLPGMAMASVNHETQYSRLYRS
jgi:urease accessory protein